MNEKELELVNVQEEIDNSFNVNSSTKQDSPQVKKLNGILKELRISWTNTIQEHDRSFDDLKNLSRNRLISDRQRLVEEIFSFQEKIEKIFRQLKQQRKQYHDTLDKYKSYQAVALQIDGHVAETEQLYNLMINHNGFLSETLKSLDHLIYGVKNKIKFEEYV